MVLWCQKSLVLSGVDIEGRSEVTLDVLDSMSQSRSQVLTPNPQPLDHQDSIKVVRPRRRERIYTRE